MAQSAGASPLTFSPAGQALLGAAGNASASETLEERKKRLLGLQAAQKNISSALSPAGSSLFNFGI
jgi:hypothetical protein